MPRRAICTGKGSSNAKKFRVAGKNITAAVGATEDQVDGHHKMIGSAEVNKSIRSKISPELKTVGFTKVRTRNNWHYKENVIWYVMFRSVGKYFSDVTGYPSQSLTCEYGAFFTNFPPHRRPALRIEPKPDKDGLLLPKEYECHYRRSLRIINSQHHLKLSLNNSAEKSRTDIWWVSEDGSNIEAVIEDLKSSLMTMAIPDLKSVDEAKVLDSWCGR